MVFRVAKLEKLLRWSCHVKIPPFFKKLPTEEQLGTFTLPIVVLVVAVVEYCCSQISTLLLKYYMLTLPQKLTGMRQTQEAWTTCSWDGGRGSSLEVADLKHQPHGGVQGDPLVTGQSQHLEEGKQHLVHSPHLHPLHGPRSSVLCHLLPSALLNFLSITADSVTSCLIHTAQIVYFSLVQEMSQAHSPLFRSQYRVGKQKQSVFLFILT